MKTKNQIEIAYIPLDKLLFKTVNVCPTDNKYCNDAIDTGHITLCDKSTDTVCPDKFYMML